jgi:hypothetical protein
MLRCQCKARGAGCCHRLLFQHPRDAVGGERDAFDRASVPDSDDFALVVKPDSMTEDGIKHVILDHHDREDRRGQRRCVQPDAEQKDSDRPGGLLLLQRPV